MFDIGSINLAIECYGSRTIVFKPIIEPFVKNAKKSYSEEDFF